MKYLLGLLSSLSLVLTGCTHARPEDLSGVQGDVDAEGKLIMYRIPPMEGEPERPVPLEGNFGLLIYFNAAKPKPPTFKLCIQHDHRILTTSSMQILKQGLSKIQAGDTLRLYNGCQGGASLGHGSTRPGGDSGIL